MGTIRCLKSFEPSYPPPTTSICCWRTFGFLWSAPHMSHVAASVHSPSSARLALHFDCVYAQAEHHVTVHNAGSSFLPNLVCAQSEPWRPVIQETSRLFISVTVCGVEIAENVPPATNYESVDSHWYCECLLEKHAVNVITFFFLCMTSSLQEARITATRRAHTQLCSRSRLVFPWKIPQICWETPPSLRTKENFLLWCLCTLGRRRRPHDDSGCDTLTFLALCASLSDALPFCLLQTSLFRALNNFLLSGHEAGVQEEVGEAVRVSSWVLLFLFSFCWPGKLKKVDQPRFKEKTE